MLIYTARSRGEGEAPLLYGCLLLSNAGSLFLPGSNLTNLIVLGHLHLSGGQFFGHMWLAALAALIATAAAIAIVERRSLHATARRRLRDPHVPSSVPDWLPSASRRRSRGAAPSPCAVRRRGRSRRDRHPSRSTPGTALAHVVSVLGVPVLVGLFGLAIALGTLGHAWSGPASIAVAPRSMGNRRSRSRCVCALQQLARRDRCSPRRPPDHPFALLVGLNLGPNLFVTGSLAWILWLRAARNAGAPAVHHQGRSPRPARGAAFHGRRRRGSHTHRITLSAWAAEVKDR